VTQQLQSEGAVLDGLNCVALLRQTTGKNHALHSIIVDDQQMPEMVVHK
jgi:hypothetical protein